MVVADRDRVRRLVALPEVRPERVAALRRLNVLIVGVGGIGSAVALYLAIQGVGQLSLVDPDRVDSSNLSRQVLYSPSQVGLPKVEAARRTLADLAPETAVTAVPERLQPANAAALVAGHDIVADGLDNGAARDALNLAAVQLRVPVVFSGAVGFEAMVFAVPAGGRPCLACLFGSVSGLEEECSVRGVLGPVVGLAGSLVAAQILKAALQVGQSPFGRLWSVDLFSDRARAISVPARPDCPVCGSSAPTVPAATPDPGKDG